MQATPEPQSATLPASVSDLSLLRMIADAASPLLAYYEITALRCRFANRPYAAHYGWDADAILGRTVREVVGEPAWEVIAPYVDLARVGQDVRYEREQALPDGDKHLIQVDLLPHVDAGQTLRGLFVQISDVTEQRHAMAMMRQSEERLRKFTQATEEGIVFHAQGLITDGNEAVERLTGYRLAEVLGRPVLDFMSDDTRHIVRESVRAEREDPYEAIMVRKDGRHVPVEIVGKTLPVGAERHRLAVVRDISVRKEAQARIEYLSSHDALTRLPNRAALVQGLERLIGQARRAGHLLAVLILDLDHFKNVNDSLGHQAGDRLLCEVASRLSASLRHGDVLARIGGDEFVIVLAGLDAPEQAADFAARLLDIVSASMPIDGHKVSVSPSIGIGVFPGDGDSADALIGHADAAMYHAKDSGRGHYQFFTPGMAARSIDALDQESRLRDALANDQFVLHYQPQIDTVDGRVTGVEALVRWQHPEQGLLGPMAFIGFAEKRGLIAAIGRWVLEQACRQIKAWHDAGHPKVPVAVNLSAIEFRQRDLVPSIAAVLGDTGLAPQYLEIELTESALLDQEGFIGERLQALKALGVRLAIDDFGTGYSSLAYLKRYPIDRLKIDRSFVKDTPDDPDDVAIVTAILQLARSLKLATVAEGVETMTQLALLRRLGCDDFQGYLAARPMAAGAMERFWRSAAGTWGRR